MFKLVLFLILVAGNLTVLGQERQAITILVNFEDKVEQPFTAQHVNDTWTIVDSFWNENVGIGFQSDVFGWVTIPLSSTTCDQFQIMALADDKARAAGINLNAYEHKVYAYPKNACAVAGSAAVAPPFWVTLNGEFSPNTLAHELGHNMGLHHSRSLFSHYGDVFDIMGGGLLYHTNIYHKEYLGLSVQEVGSGSYYVGNGLKVRRDADTYFYIEKRLARGFDLVLGSEPNAPAYGVLIHTGSITNRRDIYIMDANPITSSMWDATLLTGQTYSDGGFSITTTYADPNGDATVEIRVEATPTPSPTPSPSPTPCIRFNPKGKCIK